MAIKAPGNSSGLSATGSSGTNPAAIGNVPQWVKVGAALGFGAFSTAGTSNAITLFTLPAGGVIHATKIKASTAFGGGAISAYTLSIGPSGNATKYASAFDVFQAVSNTAFQLSSVTGSENNGAGTIIQVTATSTTANLNAATAGVVDVFALLSIAL